MQPSAIIELALSLGVVVVPTVIAMTGAFKEIFPQVNPRYFSILSGMALSVPTWFATQEMPDNLATWCVFGLVVLIGGFLPSGSFDAGVNFVSKALKKR